MATTLIGCCQVECTNKKSDNSSLITAKYVMCPSLGTSLKVQNRTKKIGNDVQGAGSANHETSREAEVARHRGCKIQKSECKLVDRCPCRIYVGEGTSVSSSLGNPSCCPVSIEPSCTRLVGLKRAYLRRTELT